MDTVAFHSLISGERHGVGPTLLRGGLSIASWFYQGAVRARNRAFDFGWNQTARAAVPVISIGNITTGGTGKTPFAAYIARWFREHRIRVCFLSRGYGAEQGRQNDEALVLERLCPDVPHLQHADRVAGARIAVEELDTQLLILDDGFQHRRLARDLDLVLIDALEPWGYGHLLPRGLLREPCSSLRRADCVILTRADQVSEQALASIKRVIKSLRGDDHCVEVAFAPLSLVNASGQTASLESLRDQAIRAFCGIGNPEGFRRTLLQLGVKLDEHPLRVFPDHHRYARDDIASLLDWTKESGAAAVVTTLKDHVKIPINSLGQTPLWSIDIGVKVLSGGEHLTERLEQVRERVPTSD